jgi:hypothetical protein
MSRGNDSVSGGAISVLVDQVSLYTLLTIVNPCYMVCHICVFIGGRRWFLPSQLASKMPSYIVGAHPCGRPGGGVGLCLHLCDRPCPRCPRALS